MSEFSRRLYQIDTLPQLRNKSGIDINPLINSTAFIVKGLSMVLSMFQDGSVNLVYGIMDSNYESRRRGQAGIKFQEKRVVNYKLQT